MEKLNGVQKYWYDANSNMTTRKVGSTANTLSYDAENHLTGMTGGSVSASFVYDGDGSRVKGTIGGVTVAYVNNYFEWTGSTSTMRKYYYAGGTRVAMRQGSSNPLWLLGDHLGSTSVTANSNGTLKSTLRFKAWGEIRYSSGTTNTKYQFTGQYSYTAEFGLLFFNARWFDPYLNRWIQADSIIPGTGNHLAWDRYAGMLGNPFLSPKCTSLITVCRVVGK